MTERDALISLVSDSYKDAYGVRPHHINFNLLSTQELRQKAYYYSNVVHRLCADEREQEAHQAVLDAEAARVAPLYNSQPLPYEDLY